MCGFYKKTEKAGLLSVEIIFFKSSGVGKLEWAFHGMSEMMYGFG